MMSTDPASAAAPLRTVTHLYDRYDDAVTVVSALEAAGVSHDRISLVAGEPSAPRAVSIDAVQTSLAELAPDTTVGRAAAIGAWAGTALGLAAGWLAATGAAALPGYGPVVAAGGLVAAVTASGIGAAAGALLGPLSGTLAKHVLARIYASRVRHGGTLVSVRTMQAEYDRIEAMMQIRTDGPSRLTAEADGGGIAGQAVAG